MRNLNLLPAAVMIFIVSAFAWTIAVLGAEMVLALHPWGYGVGGASAMLLAASFVIGAIAAGLCWRVRTRRALLGFGVPGLAIAVVGGLMTISGLYASYARYRQFVALDDCAPRDKTLNEAKVLDRVAGIAVRQDDFIAAGYGDLEHLRGYMRRTPDCCEVRQTKWFDEREAWEGSITVRYPSPRRPAQSDLATVIVTLTSCGNVFEVPTLVTARVVD